MEVGRCSVGDGLGLHSRERSWRVCQDEEWRVEAGEMLKMTKRCYVCVDGSDANATAPVMWHVGSLVWWRCLDAAMALCRVV